MAGITVKLTGLEALQARLKRVQKVTADTTFRRLVVKVSACMTEAQKTVPVVTGRLRSTAFVRKQAANQYRQDLHFGYEAPYASFVHERPEGRGYQWMRKAFLKVLRGRGVAEVKQEVIAAVRRAWGR